MKSLFSVFLLLTLGFSVSALGATYNISMRATVPSNTDVFQRQETGADWLTQVVHHQKAVLVITGEGPFASSTGTQTQTDDDVPGIADGGQGHSFAKIETDGRDFYYVTDELIVANKPEINFSLPVKNRAQVEISKGTLADYQSGKEVQFQLTKEGSKMASEVQVSSLKMAAKKIGQAIQDQLGDQGTVGEVIIDVVDSGTGAIKVSRDRIENDTKNAKFNLTIPITIQE